MKKTTALALLVMLTIVGACKKEKSVTEPSRRKVVDAEREKRKVVDAEREKTKVSITFQGLLAHVVASGNGKQDKTVVLADSDHPVTLNFPGSIDTTRLATVTGKTVGTGGGRAWVDGVTGFAVRVIGWDAASSTATTMSPALDTSDSTFDTHVPHLLKVSDNTLTFAELDPTLWDDAPAAGGKWALFVPLEGGKFTVSRKSCKQSKFVQDYQKEGPRWFAAETTLSGTVDHPPAIQFRKPGGSWEEVTFTTPPAANAVTMRVYAEASSSLGTSHFHKFARLGAPKFDDIVYVPCEQVGLHPACTNSQWP